MYVGVAAAAAPATEHRARQMGQTTCVVSETPTHMCVFFVLLGVSPFTPFSGEKK